MKQQLLDRLTPAGQEHLIAFWEELDDAGQQQLARQIGELDLDAIAQLARSVADQSLSSDAKEAWAELAAQADPPRAFRLDSDDAEFSAEQARQCGEQALRDGKLGMILVAGGQGTRLGFDHPKGMFPLGPVSKRPLFQILFELLIAVGNRYGVQIPLYVMTSPATHDETLHFLDQHERFGLPASDVRVFCQGTMPAIGDDGKILLAARDELALAPDGHGGMLAALAKSGCLDDAKDRGIEHLFYGQIDNPLIQICDPQLVGYHLLSGSEMTTQVVAKANALEKVGNVVSIDGQVQIIEYSDLTDNVAQQVDAEGSLRLWAGNIAVHIFSVEFLGRMANQADALPFHHARKKTPCIDAAGKCVEPDEPNATKFERFIFDLLPHARNAIAVEADRASAFAPVKNANYEKVDTPEIAQRLMVAQHTSWLRQTGATVTEGTKVEISPLFALDADELASKIEPALIVTKDTFFH